ncbi:MAG: hypothetical protein EBY30_18855, partial [Rhodospirillales bacterium]|nr:hypothetical protein [Rhodospirillales bacterium]
SGSSYVVFGKASGFTAAINLASLDGTSGFRLDGVGAGDSSGNSVAAAGDVNGDGFADLIVASSGADPNSTNGAGSSYIIFGKPGVFAAAINLSSLDGGTGFRLDGVATFDGSGNSVAAAGDVNGEHKRRLQLRVFQPCLRRRHLSRHHPGRPPERHLSWRYHQRLFWQ